MHGNVERQARRFAYHWFRQHHDQASEEESRAFAAGRWQEFIGAVPQADAMPEDEPAKLVEAFDEADQTAERMPTGVKPAANSAQHRNG